MGIVRCQSTVTKCVSVSNLRAYTQHVPSYAFRYVPSYSTSADYWNWKAWKSAYYYTPDYSYHTTRSLYYDPNSTYYSYIPRYRSALRPSVSYYPNGFYPYIPPSYYARSNYWSL